MTVILSTIASIITDGYLTYNMSYVWGKQGVKAVSFISDLTSQIACGDHAPLPMLTAAKLLLPRHAPAFKRAWPLPYGDDPPRGALKPSDFYPLINNGSPPEPRRNGSH